MPLPAVIAAAVPTVTRIGAQLLSKGGTISKIGGFLKNLLWGSKLAAAGTGMVAGSMLFGGGDSAAQTSAAAGQFRQYQG